MSSGFLPQEQQVQQQQVVEAAAGKGSAAAGKGSAAGNGASSGGGDKEEPPIRQAAKEKRDVSGAPAASAAASGAAPAPGAPAASAAASEVVPAPGAPPGGMTPVWSIDDGAETYNDFSPADSALIEAQFRQDPRNVCCNIELGGVGYGFDFRNWTQTDMAGHATRQLRRMGPEVKGMTSVPVGSAAPPPEQWGNTWGKNTRPTPGVYENRGIPSS